MITTIFHKKSNTYHISEPIIGRFFPNLVLVRSLRSSFIDSFSSAKKHCNTSHGFGASFGQSCDQDRFLLPFISDFPSFFLFLNFIAVSIAFLIIKVGTRGQSTKSEVYSINVQIIGGHALGLQRGGSSLKNKTFGEG